MSGAHRDEALHASVVPYSVTTTRGAVADAESSSFRARAVSAARGAVAVASPALTESITHARGARAEPEPEPEPKPEPSSVDASPCRRGTSPARGGLGFCASIDVRPHA